VVSNIYYSVTLEFIADVGRVGTIH